MMMQTEYLKWFLVKLQKSIGSEVLVLVAPCLLTCFLGLTVQAPEPFTITLIIHLVSNSKTELFINRPDFIASHYIY